MPHNGCPQQCSFCNQVSITGVQKQPEPADVAKAVQTAVVHNGHTGRKLELAFFGGSFTALEWNYMVSLLEAAQPFVTGGIITGIRISTRPDAITAPILECLQKYGVTAIELGAQSMLDSVLSANRRGHTAQQVKEASSLIRAYGFSLGLQMMTGLYQDTVQGAMRTAEEIALCRPDTVRIYPTVIMKHTYLGQLYESGAYRTLSLEETVDLCSRLLSFFEERQIRVIRLGLHSSPELERDRLAGPWHPAFGELCESRRFRTAVLRELEQFSPNEKQRTLVVHPRDYSKVVGQKKSNLRFFASMGYPVTIKTKETMQRNHFILTDTDDEKKGVEACG